MNRAEYLNIRKKVNLEHKASAYPIFVLQNIVIISLIAALCVGYSHSAIRFLAIPLIAAFIFRNLSMMHEAVHNAVSKNRKLNDLAGLLSGAVCLLAYEPWKRSHLEHHIWSGNVEKDPVTAIVTAFPKFPQALQKTLSFFWMIWIPMLSFMQYTVFWWLAYKIYVKKPTAKLAINILMPFALWGGLIALTPASFSLGILIPALLFYMLVVEVVNFPHHLQLPQYRGDTKLMVWEQHQIARSCIYPKWFARLVVLNFNYHIEHHMFPDAPWYHLEALHSEVRVGLNSLYNTDPYFQWISENKKLPIGEVLKPTNNDSPIKNSATVTA